MLGCKFFGTHLAHIFQNYRHFVMIPCISDLFCTFVKWYHGGINEYLKRIGDKLTPFPDVRLLCHWTTKTYPMLWQMLRFHWFLCWDVDDTFLYLLQKILSDNYVLFLFTDMYETNFLENPRILKIIFQRKLDCKTPYLNFLYLYFNSVYFYWKWLL